MPNRPSLPKKLHRKVFVETGHRRAIHTCQNPDFEVLGFASRILESKQRGSDFWQTALTKVELVSFMFEFQIYFDDSGTHVGSTFAVEQFNEKTFLATGAKSWRRNNAIASIGLTSCLTRSGAASPSAIGTATSASVYRKLVSIIRLRTRCEFAVCVPAIYDKYAPDEMKEHYARDHYAFAVKCCLGLIWKWRLQFDVRASMQYIFDTVTKGLGRKDEIMQI
jgi:hypothetical protein